MKGLLVLNGDKNTPLPNAKDYDLVVCADGAFDSARFALSRVDCVVGDFDSLSFQPQDVQTIKLSPQKNFTDGEIALEFMLEKGVTDVEIYWGDGLRIDHFLGNLTLLTRAMNASVSAKMVTQNERIFLCRGNCQFKEVLGKTISLFPFSDFVHIISSSGLQYQTEDLTLTHASARGISNVAIDDVVKINFDKGDCLLIINDKGV